MIYQIEYENGTHCNYAYGRKDILKWLEILKDETISDVKKLYKDGASVSVLGKYRKHINQQNEGVERA